MFIHNVSKWQQRAKEKQQFINLEDKYVRMSEGIHLAEVSFSKALSLCLPQGFCHVQEGRPSLHNGFSDLRPQTHGNRS